MIDYNNPNNKYAYVNSNGKQVCGPAAHNHYIYTECGGIDGYEKRILLNAFESFLDSDQYKNRYETDKSLEKNIVSAKDLW